MGDRISVLVTGASGFIGSRLARQLSSQKLYRVRGAVRKAAPSEHYDLISMGDLHADLDWTNALEGVDVVVHAAARVHIMEDCAADPLAEFRRVNVAGTLNLARRAAALGVKRLIFISSIKVNGELTLPGCPFTAADKPAPEDAYGVSKMEAEMGLQALASELGIEVVVIRPPLVYGPGVKGNFARMIKLVKKGIPLPLGAITNRRSLVGLDNLVDLIETCIGHPAAANQVFLAGDGEDTSTTELLRGVGKAMRKPVRLVPVPEGVLMVGASLLGMRSAAQRLLGSLQVDISKTRQLLDWEPPLSLEEGLRRCFVSESGR